MESRGISRDLGDERIVGKPEQIGRFKFPPMLLDRSTGRFLPSQVLDAGSAGNHKKLSRTGLKPPGQREGSFQIQLEENPGGLRGRLSGRIAFRRDAGKNQRNLGRDDIPMFLDELQRRSAHGDHHIGRLAGVLLPHEGGCACFVPGVGDAHEIEKLGVDHELLLAALTKPLLDTVDRLSGGGKRIIEPAQNEHTTRRLLCVGLS